MKILLLGDGGKEDAISWKLNSERDVEKIYLCPGNGGTFYKEKAENIAIDPFTPKEIADTVKKLGVNLVVIGWESLFFDGTIDVLKSEGVAVLGPDAQASRLESSRGFARSFMDSNGIPSIESQEFTDREKLIKYVRAVNGRYVLKVDGFTGGKGLYLIDSKNQGLKVLEDIFASGVFSKKDAAVYAEPVPKGEEFSVTIVTDGTDYVLLPVGQSFPRAFDHDMGLFTPGMGAYLPNPFFEQDMLDKIERDIISKTLAGLGKAGIDYHGFLTFDCIIDAQGIKLMGYTVRIPDPYIQAVLPLMSSSLATLFTATLRHGLGRVHLKTSQQKSVAVILASKGYPVTSEKGVLIAGLDKVDTASLFIFHSGTRAVKYNRGRGFLTDGGRVLTVVGTGDSFESARETAYSVIDGSGIYFDGMFFRRDIAIAGVAK